VRNWTILSPAELRARRPAMDARYERIRDDIDAALPQRVAYVILGQG
jgi:hypothetical protein